MINNIACVFERNRATGGHTVTGSPHCSRLDADDEEHGVVLLGAATHLHRVRVRVWVSGVLPGAAATRLCIAYRVGLEVGLGTAGLR